MKKILLPPLTCFIVVSLWVLAHKRIDTVSVVPEEFQPRPLPEKEVAALRVPSSVKQQESKVEGKKKSLTWAQEKYRAFPGLAEDLKLAENLYTISAADFTPTMGELVSSDGKNVIFRADIRPTRANFLAIDLPNDRLYPIAPSVKIANVSEQVRNALINEGFIEKYYNEDLQVMFVESDEKNVLEAYSSLTGLRLEAELEVIRGYNRAR